MEFFLDDGHEDENADRDPDLRLHGVLGSAVKGFDVEMLFDPFEKKFHLPSAVIQLRDRQGGKREVVRQKDEASIEFRIDVRDAAQGIGVFFGSLGAAQDDDLIAAQSEGSVDGLRGAPTEIEIALGADDEERGVKKESVKALEIDVAAVHDVEGPRLQFQFVEGIDIVRESLCDMNKTGDIAAQVDHRVHLHAALVSPKPRPWEERKTQVDGRRIEGVSGLFQRDAKVVADIQGSSPADQDLSEIGIDAPVSQLVGVGQGAPGHVTAKAGAIEFRLHRLKAEDNFPQAFSPVELSEGHAEKLVVTHERSHAAIAVVAFDASVEFVSWKEIHQLRKNGAPEIHQPLLDLRGPEKEGEILGEN